MRHEQKLWHLGIALLHALFCMPFHSLHFNLQRNAAWCLSPVSELKTCTTSGSPGEPYLPLGLASCIKCGLFTFWIRTVDDAKKTPASSDSRLMIL